MNNKRILKISLILMTVGALLSGIGYIFSDGKINPSVIYKGTGTYKREEHLEYFDKIQLDIMTANVEIEQGTEAKLEYNLSEPLEYKIDNDTLYIKYDKPKRFGFNMSSEKIIITVLEDSYRDITIRQSVGNLVMSQVVVDNLSVLNEVGNIEMNSINVDKGVVTNEVGNIKIYTSVLNKLQAENEVGNIVFEGELHGESKITNQIGKVDITLPKVGPYVNAHSDIGKINVDNSNIDRSIILDLSTEVGKIYVTRK